MDETAQDPRRADLDSSDPHGSGTDGLAGDMGVSSERVGKVRGSAQPKTHGTEETTPEPGDDVAATDDDAVRGRGPARSETPRE